MTDFPAHVTITREAYGDEKPFVPPQPPRHRRVTREDFSSGSTITREIFDDEPVRDADYTESDLHREREARELTQAATDSILRPAHLADRGTNQ